MALPSTGVPWKTSGLNVYDGQRARRGGLVAVLIRDYGGASTDLSPGGAFGSPFAQDGQLRNDLLITTPFSVSPTNCGFWRIGALDPKGVSRKPKITVDKLEILQSNNPIRSDIQMEEKTVNFIAFENTPLLDRLEFNKPLTNVEDVGLSGYFQGKPTDADFVQRQIILIRADKASGQPEYTAEPYPLVTLADIGEAVMDKKKADARDLTWDTLIDPYFVDVDGSPISGGRWRSGAGWQAGGGAPVFPAPVPVAAATTTGKATLTFATPTGVDIHPISYTGQKSTDAGVTWTAATLFAPIPTSTVIGGSTVLTFTGLTAGATMLRAVATGSNGLATTSSASNSATIT
jgi:hypothetical protein